MAVDLGNIGFNNDVGQGARRLHVQTEVIELANVTIRTTVLDNGAVKHVESQACPTGELDEQQTRALAEAQHNDIVAKVTTGKIS